MNELQQMKVHYHYFMERLQHGVTDQSMLQHALDQLEGLLYALCEKERVDFHHKDEMMVEIERYTKEKLMLLEEKVKNQQAIAHIQEHTVRVADAVKAFWKEAGFHYVKKFSVNQYGTIELTLGFDLNYGSMTTDQPVTAKKQVEETKERLREEGYIFNEKGRDLLDCDSNKQKISQLIQNRFPSARIFSWETYISNHKTQEHNLRYVELRLSKIEEIIPMKTPQ